MLRFNQKSSTLVYEQLPGMQKVAPCLMVAMASTRNDELARPVRDLIEGDLPSGWYGRECTRTAGILSAVFLF